LVVDPDSALFCGANAILDPAHAFDARLDSGMANDCEAPRITRIGRLHGDGEAAVKIRPSLEEPLGMATADAIVDERFRCEIGRTQKAREIGFHEVLAEHYPGCCLSSVLQSGENAERVGLLTLPALKENPSIRGICHATSAASEVVEALASAKRRGANALIAHELTVERRALLKTRAIDAVIDQNPEFEVRAAVELMARLHGRMEGAQDSVITPVQICCPENV
jgi:hypothetical protein